MTDKNILALLMDPNVQAAAFKLAAELNHTDAAQVAPPTQTEIIGDAALAHELDALEAGELPQDPKGQPTPDLPQEPTPLPDFTPLATKVVEYVVGNGMTSFSIRAVKAILAAAWLKDATGLKEINK